MRKPQSLFPSNAALPLMTDLYELTMAAGYLAAGKRPTVAFEAYVRVLPANRSFLVAAGLEQALQFILDLRFDGAAVGWVRSLPQMGQVPEAFFEYLREFRFKGDVWAVPEGTVVFANEPLVRVQGDMIEAQILETYLLTCLNLQTLVATKAARIVLAAAGRPVMDFGARRAHGPQAGLLAARASIIGGCAGTSNVEAARILGVPAIGTMAHSWVMAFEDEAAAFQAFHEVFPADTICLVDTYDTLRGAEIAARTLGPQLGGVRLDSGDLLDLARRVRGILDGNGAPQAQIVASGDLNEYAIRQLLAAGAPIDSFGVGTDMVTSKDAPALSVVYKLVAVREDKETEGRGDAETRRRGDAETGKQKDALMRRRGDNASRGGAPTAVDGAGDKHAAGGAGDVGGTWRPVVKSSLDKATLGGRKQVWRQYGADGLAAGDVVGLADEAPAGEPLLQQYIAAGALRVDLPGVRQIAERAKRQLAALPEPARKPNGGYAYPVRFSDALRAAQPQGPRVG
jgi:nicotinate phosphoribosyltransferase